VKLAGINMTNQCLLYQSKSCKLQSSDLFVVFFPVLSVSTALVVLHMSYSNLIVMQWTDACFIVVGPVCGLNWVWRVLPVRGLY